MNTDPFCTLRTGGLVSLNFFSLKGKDARFKVTTAVGESGG